MFVLIGTLAPVIGPAVVDARLLYILLVPVLFFPFQSTLISALKAQERHAWYAWYTAAVSVLSGVVSNEDQFTLQMLDTREQLHLLEKEKLRSVEKRRESAMPVYDQKALSDKDLQDLIAYLQTAGAQ